MEKIKEILKDKNIVFIIISYVLLNILFYIYSPYQIIHDIRLLLTILFIMFFIQNFILFYLDTIYFNLFIL